MRRSKATTSNYPIAILTADWHLREDTPKCRTDDFWKAQWSKVDFISHLQGVYDCPVLHAGDLFNHWKPSPLLLSTTMQHLPKQFNTIYGNHDLPQHSMANAHKSGIAVLEEAGVLSVLNGVHWGDSFTCQEGDAPISTTLKGREGLVHALVWHILAYPLAKPPWPGCDEGFCAEDINDMFPDSLSLILTGHYHRAFKLGRVVNPGCLTRQSADKYKYQPVVYLWYSNGEIEKISVPAESGVVSRDHLQTEAKARQRNERMEAFLSHLSDDTAATVSFEDNVNKLLSEREAAQSVRDIVRTAVYGTD